MSTDIRHRNDHTGTRRFNEGIEKLAKTRQKRALSRFSRGIDRRDA
jgi:hypothetical protein